MTGNISRVAAARPADMEPLISIMVLAFAADPVARWMYRDPQRYLAYFGQFIRAFAGKAFSSGTAWRLDGNLGGALWLPPGVKPDEDAIATILDESVPGEVMADVNAMVPADDRHRAPPPPQGARIGTADASAQPVRPGARAGLSGIQQLRQHGVIPAVRLRGAGRHTCGLLAADGPDAAGRTLNHFKSKQTRHGSRRLLRS
jgi:hypothetical protein